MKRSFKIILAVIVTSLTVYCATNVQASEQAPPNILLIVADDLGFSDLGCYGGEIETPNLDRLAENGIRLTQFYTTGRCCPSRASLLTGQYPHRVGLGHMTKDIGRPGYRGKVSPAAKTIAEQLQPAGYRSFLSGKWHLGTEDPTQHGFEEFYGTLVSAKTFWEPNHFLRMPQERKRRQYEEKEFYGTDSLGDYAIDFLNEASQTPEKPWFLYLAFNAPHFPLHARPETIAKYADRYKIGWDQLRRQRLEKMQKLGVIPKATQLTPRSRFYDWAESQPGTNPAWDSLSEDRRLDLARRMAIYAAMVDSLDQNIGRVLKEIKKNNDLDNTLIVFTSDNGACAEWDSFGFDGVSGPDNVLHKGDEIEKMGSRDSYHSAGSGWANASNSPWRLYKHYNHEGGIAVPCIISWSVKMKAESPKVAGSINSTSTHLIDLLPTFLAATGKVDSTEAIATLPGQSLLPLIAEGTLSKRNLYFEHEGNRAIRTDRWKLVALRNQPWELYDMQADRTELDNLAQSKPKLVQRLEKSWNRWASENYVTPLPEDYEVPYLPVLESER